ncbi:Methionyl-tRNA formyltransferase [Candidatus Syntrophocurvum alkaliphilum]|uniref:Methionyl-tRNA formyltransferase n=1 Tax=Candidatus Syntrophocurvum alkaliphilum TaxID=2293317 RepID=A0A6I6DEQ1_9FIRM|nr:methionyl-tRNA formyltransferase [Candidatus Syntrophocurvum alkaliphilum]QGT99617.1 Methionyl-tRNA formyltransferase [Candidatus Syntrophocurvum alkaliphilum]
MKIVFMGTSNFAVPSLEKLIKSDHDIVAIVTQPDRPRGRGKKLEPTPVKSTALLYNLPVLQPERIKQVEAIESVKNYQPDLIVVVAYGQIIPIDLLEYPKLGCINVHASLLPKYRGAAPIQRAIMAGEKTTGITTMFMDEGLDTGDIIMQLPVTIEPTMDYGELEQVMAKQGAKLLIDTIANLASGSLPRRKQDESKSTYAKMLTKEEEKIQWSNNALDIINKIRALSPTPGAYTSYKGTKIKVFKALEKNKNKNGVIGEVLEITENGFIVQCQDGTIEVIEVQKEGKKRISSKEFLRGFKLHSGDVLGD